MTKFYIESASTMIRTISFVGMILGDTSVKIISAFFMIAINFAKVVYEYNKVKGGKNDRRKETTPDGISC